MSDQDVIVVGGGISGLAFAWEAAQAGRRVLVVEKDRAVGGCLASRRGTSGYWYELGAHTCYNSYVGLVGMIDGLGLRGEVLQRAPTKMRFLDAGKLVAGANQWALLRLFDNLELLRSLPRMMGAKKDGQTVYGYYSRIVGRKNYGRVLGPMLSAVPSQSADSFPAGMLFKARRTRRRDYPRSFTVRGGLQAVAEAVGRQPRVALALGQGATRVERSGSGWAVTTEDGSRHEAPVMALAVQASVAAALARDAAPELAAQLSRIREAVVESVGVVVRAEKTTAIPVSMFIVPLDDVFHSVVTRDSVPDPGWRAFTFHFKPGATRAGRLRRLTEVLGVTEADLEEVGERRTALPSPVLGHEQVVGEIDRLLEGQRLSVTGNYFAGLSIEDCVSRSREEWARVEKLQGVGDTDPGG